MKRQVAKSNMPSKKRALIVIKRLVRFVQWEGILRNFAMMSNVVGNLYWRGWWRDDSLSRERDVVVTVISVPLDSETV